MYIITPLYQSQITYEVNNLNNALDFLISSFLTPFTITVFFGSNTLVDFVAKIVFFSTEFWTDVIDFWTALI